MRAGFMNRAQNGFKNQMRISEDFVIGKAQDAIAMFGENGRALRVPADILIFGMLSAIQLDNQVLRHASEIGDVTSDRNLSTKSETLKLLAPQQ